jgi:hypothetical protein
MSRAQRRSWVPVALLAVSLSASCSAPQLPLAGPPHEGGAYPAARASRSADYAGEAAATPAGRPGLGTEWGETRHSEVTHTAFERASSSPTAVGAFYYNDRQGADAMAGRDDFRRLAEAVFALPGLPVTVSIRDGGGDPLPAVSSGVRCYAVGEAGARYTIMVQNHSALRLEIVASVDGLDVIDGKPAGYGKRGYLIRPYGSLSIDGWRQSDESVAAFRFGSVRDSYAARTGSDRHVGVIGVALFHERGAQPSGPWTDEELQKRQSADPFPNRYATPPPPRID